MGDEIKKGHAERRPAHVPEQLDPDYESRTLDEIIAALDDIGEMEGADVFIKWEPRPGPPHPVPILTILFARVVGQGKLPMVHLDDQGVKRPAHQVCLALIPSGELLSGMRLRDVVRRGVEGYLLGHGIRYSSIDPARAMREAGPVAFRPAEFERRPISILGQGLLAKKN